MLYYNSNDLSARLQRVAIWISKEAYYISRDLKFTGRIDNKRLLNLEYVVASLEILECYTPILNESEDGVINCLTEEEAENLFKNIEKITKLCFLPKNNIYEIITEDDNNQFTELTLNGFTNLFLNSNKILELNTLKSERI
jgi:hypothetical protein